MKLKVIQYGLGPIGMESAKYLAQKAVYELVGAVDIAPEKAGKDLGEMLSVANLEGITVTDKLANILKQARVEVALHTTGSFLEQVYPQLEELITAGVHVVSSCEELSFPWYHHPDLAKRIDSLAKENGVAVLGTGVNPGFVMDELVLCLASVCKRVERVQVKRVLDAGKRRGPLQKKVGAGITEHEFQERVKNKAIGHVGLAESVAYVAGGLGWNLDSIDETIGPVISARDVKTDFVQVNQGQVAGVRMQASGKRNGREVISLELQIYVGAESSYDAIHIEGEPNLETRVEGGVPGDVATVAKLVNSIPRVVEASPGLLRPLNLGLLQS